jgi:hypothetical protein
VSTFHGWAGAAILVGGPLALLAVAEVSDLVRRRCTNDPPSLTITLWLPQDEIDRITQAAGSESLAGLTARALRSELHKRTVSACSEGNRDREH